MADPHSDSAAEPTPPPSPGNGTFARRRLRPATWAMIVAVALAATTAVICTGLAQTKQGSLAAPVSFAREPRVFVHYMPWFRAEKMPGGGIEWEHWKWFGKGQKHDPDTILENGRRDIDSVYYPLAGPYDGRDVAVLEYHMLSAKTAGVDGFIADWYGPADYSDQVFAAMVKAGERHGMKVAICLEEKTFFPPYSGAKTNPEAQAAMESQIRHVLRAHAVSPAYLRHHGQPVFYMFKNFGNTGTLSPAEIAEVLSRFDAEASILLVRGGFDPNYLEAARGSYVWCPEGSDRQAFYRASEAAWKEKKFDYWVGGAYPGFDDRGCSGWGNGPRVVSRRGTGEYEDTWNEVLQYRTPFVQISTWNDFEEGTTIEPSEEYRFTFLDLTEKYVGRFTGRAVNLNDNERPWRLYRLRRQVEELENPELKADWTRRLDAYSRALAENSGWFMGWRLARLETALEADLKEAKSGKNSPSTQKEGEKKQS